MKMLLFCFSFQMYGAVTMILKPLNIQNSVKLGGPAKARNYLQLLQVSRSGDKPVLEVF